MLRGALFFRALKRIFKKVIAKKTKTLKILIEVHKSIV